MKRFYAAFARLGGQALLAIVLLATLGAVRVNAQAQTTVTATVTDPLGIPYAGGTVKAQIQPAGPPSPCVVTGGNCVPIQGTVGPVPMDTTGSFTMNVYPNSIITPGGTQWLFTVCISPGAVAPIGTGAQCFSVLETISGSSQSLTASLSAAAPALSNLASTTLTPADNIQTAVNNLLAGGGAISLGPGTFTLPSTLQLNKPVFLMCAGTAATTITAPNGFNADLIDITASNTRITNCGLNGNGANQTAGSTIGIPNDGLQSILIDHNFITQSWGPAVNVPNGVSLSQIEANDFTANNVTASATAFTIFYEEIAAGQDYGFRVNHNNIDSSANANSGVFIGEAGGPGDDTITDFFAVNNNLILFGTTGGYATYGVEDATSSANGGGELSNCTIDANIIFPFGSPTATGVDIAAFGSNPQLNVNSNNLLSFGTAIEVAMSGTTQSPSADTINGNTIYSGEIIFSARDAAADLPVNSTINGNTLNSQIVAAPFIAVSAPGGQTISNMTITGNAISVSTNPTAGQLGLQLTNVQDSSIAGNSFQGDGAASVGALISLINSSGNIFGMNVFSNQTGSGNGAIAILGDSTSDSNTVGPNQFTSVTTPTSLAGTGTIFGATQVGAVTPGHIAAWGSGLNGQLIDGGTPNSTVLANYYETLSSDITLTGASVSPILVQSVTMPSAGCPCRAVLHYGVWWSSLNGTLDTDVNDGTNSLATSQASGIGTATGGMTGSQVSNVTYANNAAVTFTLQGEPTVGGTVKAVPAEMGQNTFLSISIVTSQ